MARVALVTGGTRGIGAAISKALKAAGYKVAASYAGNDAAAEKFKSETGIPVYKWDVSSFNDCAAGVKKVEADTDLRIGGRYFIRMMMANDEHYSSGVYREIVPNEKLVFTWAWKSTPERESLVTVTIKPDGDGSVMTLLREQFFDEAARDNHNKGWTAIIGRLEQLLEA